MHSSKFNGSKNWRCDVLSGTTQSYFHPIFFQMDFSQIYDQIFRFFSFHGMWQVGMAKEFVNFIQLFFFFFRLPIFSWKLIALGFHPNSNSNIWLAKENNFNQFLGTPFGLNLGLNKVHETMVQKT